MRGLRYLYVLLISIIFITACGTQETIISSLKIAVSPEEPTVDVDVAEWEDTNNDNICDTAVVQPNVVNINLEATPVSTNLVDTENTLVIVDEVNIDYFPVSSTVSGQNAPPPLPSVSHKMGIAISSQSASVSIPVEIFSQAQKSTPPLSDLKYGGPRWGHIYTYDVRITFIIKSPYTGETGKVTTYIIADVSEFKGDQENCNFQ